MGTKNNPGEFDCYNKAEDDEPTFTVLARDPLAPGIVRRWVKRRLGRPDPNPEKIAEARQTAKDMEVWLLQNRPERAAKGAS